MPLETEIKAEALKLGFVVCGIARLTRPDTYDAFQDWIEAGCHAGMAYLAKPESLGARADPASLLPGSRSVICVGLPYLPPEEPEPAAITGRGVIAAYARFPDYHKVLSAKLKQLGERLPALAGHAVSFRPCVDSAPILEKDLARRAGLGWVGRNSLLNAPGFGSYLVLGELLTDLALTPDTPLPGDPCHGCRLCVQACPTQALRPNRSVDARRCLSYLSIEHRGAIPAELRPELGGRVFGCDTCQTVCPLNQTPRETPSVAGFISGYPDLLEEFMQDETAWRAKYQGTPVLRTGFTGYRRNLAIALANTDVEGAAPALRAALDEELTADLRETFLWALAQLGRNIR